MLIRNALTGNDPQRFRIQLMSLKFWTHGERLSQAAGAVRKVPSTRAATTHGIFASHRFKRSNQHAFRHSFWSCYCIKAPVNTIIEVHIGCAWRAE
jgi:hypothetical protein